MALSAVAAIFLVLSAGVATFVAHGYNAGLYMRNHGIAASGTAIGKRYFGWTGRRTTYFIKYRFSPIDGTVYPGAPYLIRERSVSEVDYFRTTIGDPVPVLYDPRDPGHSILNISGRKTDSQILKDAIFFGVLGLIFVSLFCGLLASSFRRMGWFDERIE
jgi:hypothetical protein